MMGFNAARLEWNAAGLAASPKSVTTSDCDVATAADIESSLLPPSTTDTPQPTGNVTLPQTPPTITGDICSSDLPTTSTKDRYVYMVNYLCGQVCTAPLYVAGDTAITCKVFAYCVHGMFFTASRNATIEARMSQHSTCQGIAQGIVTVSMPLHL